MQEKWLYLKHKILGPDGMHLMLLTELGGNKCSDKDVEIKLKFNFDGECFGMNHQESIHSYLSKRQLIRELSRDLLKENHVEVT